MGIGESIREVRKARGMTQAQLGKACGMPDSQVRKYESGTIEPKLETLLRIATALDCTLPDLLGEVQTFDTGADFDKTWNEAAQKNRGGDDPDREQLLHNYDRLNDDGKKKVVEYSDDIAKIMKYKKE